MLVMQSGCIEGSTENFLRLRKLRDSVVVVPWANPEVPLLPTSWGARLGLSRMLLFWTWMLALGLLAGRGETQNCTQVFGGPDLAKDQIANASSTNYPGPESVVDGNCFKKTCFCTDEEVNSYPWWSVDLHRKYAISVVVVKNPVEGNGEWIKGATIHVGHYLGDFSNTSCTCGTIANITDHALSTILCNGAVGQHITVVIPGDNKALSLCEVEVYGTYPPGQCCQYLSQPCR
ncbi:UNVERIFIED_CONTAM: hypothetical protein K2H54_002339 [Gekko kuhli]